METGRTRDRGRAVHKNVAHTDRREAGGFGFARLASGGVLGAFLGIGAWLLGAPQMLHWEDMFAVPTVLGALLGLTRARTGLWVASTAMAAGLITIGYTPLVPHLLSRNAVDALRPAPAVVVLSAYVHQDGSLSGQAQDRLLQGYALLRQGYAQEMVLTDSTDYHGSQVPAVRRQMRLLGLDYPVDVAGSVRDTHDEALAVARLARARGWRRVLLVTHPWHMRRAAAVFEKAGLNVIRSPCAEGEYDLYGLDTAPGRLRAFQDWLHETVGYAIYRHRGWI